MSLKSQSSTFQYFQLKNETIKTKIKLERKEGGSHAPKTSTSKSSSSHKLKSFDLRNKLITKVKSASEQELERQKSRLKKYRSGIVLSRGSKERSRSPSVNSISSGESILSDKPTVKKKRKKDDQSDPSLDEGETGSSKKTIMANGHSKAIILNMQTCFQVIIMAR